MVAGSLLFSDWIRDVRTTGQFLEIVINQRATVQIVVSIIAAALAALNVYILTTLLNQAARIHLLRKPLSLTTIKFIGAIASRRWGSGLPIPLFVGAFVAVLLFAIPNVMWTGALTPILVTVNSTMADAIPLPRYSVKSNDTWSNNGQISRSACHAVTLEAGIFSDCATATIQSSMLQRAAQASENDTALHNKIDYSHYSYVGRSYGVGGAVGIFDGRLPGSIKKGTTLLNYNYTEPGYLTDVKCSHNASLDYGIVPIAGFDGETDNGTPSLFSAQGYFPWETPNGGETNIEHFAVVGFDEDSLAVLSCKQSQPKGGTKMIIIVAGNSYPFLNMTQCFVTFTPTMFAVEVDVQDRLIHVQPQHNMSDDAFDPTGGLATTLVNQLNSLSMIATTMYTSTVGDALMANLNSSMNATSTVDDKYEVLGQSFAVMFDDLLTFIGSSQFFLPFNGDGDYTLSDAGVTMQAVQVGETAYVIATFILCMVLILLVIEEAIRTVGWRQLPRWDLTDPTCLVLAGAVAGNDLLSRVEERELRSGRGVWSGDGREGLGGARLRLGQKVVATTGEGGLQALETDDGRPVQLTAVSFHTHSSRDTEPLR
jgi:hypothetical protein